MRRRLALAVGVSLCAALGLLASCSEPFGLAPQSAPAAPETAALVTSKIRALSGSFTVSEISVDARPWGGAMPASGATGADILGAFAGLPAGGAGYTNGAVALPNLARAPVTIDYYPPEQDPTLPATCPPYPAVWDTTFAGPGNPGGATANVASRYRIALTASDPTTMTIRLGVDFKGGAVIVDGQAVAAENWNGPGWLGHWLTDVGPTPAIDPVTGCYLPYTPVWVSDPAVLEATITLASSAGNPTNTHVIEFVGFEDGTVGKATVAAEYAVDTGWVAFDAPPQVRTLTVAKAGTGDGRITSTPAGLDCGATCSQDFAWGADVTLTAAPAPTVNFVGWSGPCVVSTTSPLSCVTTMDAAQGVATTVTAEFRQTYSGTAAVQALTLETRYWDGSVQPSTPTATSLFDGLPVGVAGYTNEPVSVASLTDIAALFTAPLTSASRDIASRGLITLNSTGSSEVAFRVDADFGRGGMLLADGTVLDARWVPLGPGAWTLGGTAVLTPGAHVVTVIGFEDCCGTGGMKVEFDDGHGWTSVSAPPPPPVALTVAIGAGGGTVTSTPAGISCGAACTASFVEGTQVALAAVPDPLFLFTGWSGACAGTGPCVVRMQGAQAVTATFTRKSFALTVTSTAGTGGGTVLCDAGTCASDLPAGTIVTLTAVPDANSVFVAWGGACSGTSGPTCTVTMSDAQAVVATFDAAHQLVATKSGAGGGTVVSSPAGIDCGIACAATYASGAQVVLTATPDANSTFAGWSGDCTGTGTCTVSMSAARSVDASFAQKFTGTVSVQSITIETRAWDRGAFTHTGALAEFQSLPTNVAGYTNEPVRVNTLVKNSALVSYPSVGANLNLASDYRFAVNSTGQSELSFHFSADMGAGGALLVDGAELATNWIGSSGGLLLSGTTVLANGPHLIEVVGFEDCCDGFVPTAEMNFGTGWLPVVDPAPLPAIPLTVSRTGEGVVSSTPAGINCGPTCISNFPEGTQVALSATPDAYFGFTGWGGACTGTTACVVRMQAATSITAAFDRLQYPLSVSVTGNGSVTSAAAGISCVAGGPNCTAGIAVGATVTLVATPAPGSIFEGWSGACSGTGDCVVTMDAAQAVSATFKTLVTLSATTVGSGTVTSVPAGISCTAAGGASCTATLVEGTPVTLTATAAAGFVFTGWSGAGCAGTGTCAPVMNVSQAVTATFKQLFPLAIATAGSGAGAVSCGAGPCAPSYVDGTVVTLTATAAAGSVFSGWSGACSGSGACAVTMSAAQAATATFTKVSLLTVTRAGTGGGTVSSSPAGIDNCGAATCLASFDASVSVTLTATPDATSIFSGWSGGCSGTGTCTVAMSQAQTVTATFTRNLVALHVSVVGSGTGTVTSTPSGINCGSLCSMDVTLGTQVTLTATAGSGSAFVGWTGGGCSGNHACVVAVNGEQSVTAEFRDSKPPLLSCVASPNKLWPANHKLVDVHVRVSFTDAGSGIAGFTLLSVESNEPDGSGAQRSKDEKDRNDRNNRNDRNDRRDRHDDRGNGDGHTLLDIVGWREGTPDVDGQLRAERAGNRDDRVYTLTYRGKDVAGNATTASCTVTVPHDPGKRD